MRDIIKGMFVGLLCAVIGAIIASCSTTGKVRENAPNLGKFGEVKNNAVPKYEGLIRLKNASGSFVCTAFVIDGQYAVTAAHCLDHAKGLGLTKKKFRIFDKENVDTEVKAEAVGMDAATDQGLVRGDFKDFQPLYSDFNGYPLLADEKVFATCGFPQGQKSVLCTPFIPKSPYFFGMRGLGVLLPGQSGGPVFDLTTGLVVGINSGAGNGFVEITPLTGFLANMGIEND